MKKTGKRKREREGGRGDREKCINFHTHIHTHTYTHIYTHTYTHVHLFYTTFPDND